MSDDLTAALDGLLAPVDGPAAYGQAPRRERSAEWRPGVVWAGDDGTVTTDAVAGDRQPEWDEVLRVWDLDPGRFAVVEPVLFNAWDAMGPGGTVERMRQWKARVIRRTVGATWDVEAALEDIRRFKPVKAAPPSGDGVFHVVLGDWQIGKPDGDGLKGTVARVLQASADVEARVRELRRAKRPLGTLLVEWTGDSVEGCLGHYPSQSFGVEVDRRGQVKIARRLLRDALIRWSRLFDSVVVVAVAGNHGENRRGKADAFTGPGDNDDLAVVEQVADILAANREAFGHVSFAVPPDHLSVTVEAAGWIVGLTHGHVARETGTAEQKLRRWYERQAGGKQPIGDCDILVSGHYHHLRVADWGGCVWLQAPALDGGSESWRMSKGEASQPGVLTFASYPDRRIADLAVL